MNIIKTKINGVLLVKNNTFYDNRGKLIQTLNSKFLKESNLRMKPNLTLITHSLQNTIRGMHNQYKNHQDKLVTVIDGKIQDVVIDLKKSSSTFASYESFEITEKTGYSLYIPHWCAHGFLTKTKKSIICYNINNEYDPESQQTIKWNDDIIDINWKINEKSKAILSKNDQLGINFSQSHFFK